jgi:hypothetical protein
MTVSRRRLRRIHQRRYTSVLQTLKANREYHVERLAEIDAALKVLRAHPDWNKPLSIVRKAM